MDLNDLDIEILPNGTVRVTTGAFAGAAHMAADAMVRELQREFGGDVKIVRGKTHAHGHSHDHDHDHEHTHEGHAHPHTHGPKR